MASRESARRFHFLREIASGGFGSVYLAKVMHADGFSRIAAVKLLHRRWSENREIAQRMRDEARLLGWLRHRNIVDVFDLTSIDGRAAVIMEYLEAVDLKAVTQSLTERGELMPARTALEIIACVASALDAAYNRPPYQGEKPLRVIHRDIKPSNIMVDESGSVKVLDFGVARAEFDNRESHTQELQFGSVDYMPPERLFFEPETDLSDVYSLGATFYEMLAGTKLGKAKGRAEKHAIFLEDRLSFLAARNPVPPPHGESVQSLLRAMCAYALDQRPRAADVVARCRGLVRALDGESLSEWAERVIPTLVKQARDAPFEPNPLHDAVLAEDSILFSAADVAAFERAAAVVETGVVVGQDDVLPAEIPREDRRWELLRQAALAEIAAGEPGNPFADDAPTRVGEGAAAPRPAERKPLVAMPTMVPDDPEPNAPPRKPALFERPPSAPPKGKVSEPATLRSGEPTLPKAPAPPGEGKAPAAAKAPPVEPKVDPAASSVEPPPAKAAKGRGVADAGVVRSPASLPPEGVLSAAVLAATLDAPAAEPVPDTPPAPAAAPQVPTAPVLPVVPAPTNPVDADAATTAHPIGARVSLPPVTPEADADAATTVVRTTVPPVAVDEPPRRVVPPPPPRPSAARANVSPASERPGALDEPEAPRRSLLLPILGGFVVLGLLCAGVGLGGWQLYARFVAGGAATVPTPTSPPSSTPTASAPAPAPAVDLGPYAIHFTSAAPDTQRLTVNCGAEDYSGAGEVAIPGPTAANCTVRVILKDRSRLVASVPSVATGTYTCFAGGAKTCTK